MFFILLLLTVWILICYFSEEQARSLLRSERDVRKESSGDILNNVGTMEYNQANGQLAVSFRNMVCNDETEFSRN